MTNLIYNGVQLRNCETKRFDQQIEYDESGTDVMYSRFRIRVTAILTSYSYDGIGRLDHPKTIKPFGDRDEPYNQPVDGSLPERIREVHRRLSQAGKLFYFYIPGAPTNGKTMPALSPPGPAASDLMLIAIGQTTPKPPSSSSNDAPEPVLIPVHPERPGQSLIDAATVADVDNGPKPIHVSVDSILGGRSMQVTFEIEVCRKLCGRAITEENDPYPPTEPRMRYRPDNLETTDTNEEQAELKIKPSEKILSNRWKITETKDASWATTRVMEGTMRVTNKSILPHLMRYLVVPPLMRGYQRVSQTFANDPTDLVLKYRIEDKERHESPPAPAIDWSGHFAETGSKLGTHQVAEMNIRLVGPPGVDKQALIGAAGRVVNARMRGLKAVEQRPDESVDVLDPNDQSVKLLHASVVEVIGEPIIEMRVQVQYAGADRRFLAMRLKRIGERLNKEPIDVDGNDQEPPNSIDGYYPDEWPSPLPFDSETPAGIFSCYLQNPCSRWHSPVAYPEEFETPYTPDEYDSETSPGLRPKMVLRRQAYRDYDVRMVTSTQPFRDPDPIVVDDNQFKGAPYTLIKIRSKYVTKTGRVQIPFAYAPVVCSSGSAADQEPPQDTCLIVRLHGGQTQRIFRMEAIRDGAIPQVPEPKESILDPNGIREELLDSSVVLDAPRINADGIGRQYRVAVEYVYALSRSPKMSERLRMAISPIDATEGELRYIEGLDFYSPSLTEWQEPSPDPEE